LSAIIEGMAARLQAENRPCGRVSIYPGSTEVWDLVGPEGQLYLRLVQTFPSTNFPYQSYLPTGDGNEQLTVIRLAMGVLRCGAVLDDAGNPPSPAAITADGLAEVDDTLSLINFYYDDLRGLTAANTIQSHFGQVSPKPMTGAIHGVEMDFFIAVPRC